MIFLQHDEMFYYFPKDIYYCFVLAIFSSYKKLVCCVVLLNILLCSAFVSYNLMEYPQYIYEQIEKYNPSLMFQCS